MTINPQYMLAPSLQMYLVDAAGNPLIAGTLKFFVDTDRSLPKDVFTISGTPPDYTYTDIGSVVAMNGNGTFSDNDGHIVLPYYYPFDAEGNLQLYFIEIYDSLGSLVNTVEGFPNFESGDELTTEIKNYVPNPQFLLQNYISSNGLISQAVTNIAPGGWTFVVPNVTTSVNFVTFSRYGSATLNPTGNPRYALNVVCTVPSGSDALKDITLTFSNVNMFASPAAFLTFSATMQSQSAGAFNVELIMIRNFGAGGSAQTQTVLTTFNVATSSAIYTFAFQPGDNVGKTIGSLDDDNVEFVLRLPLSVASNLLLTDVLLTDGDITISAFPNTTNAETIAASLAGGASVPSYSGNNSYLPIILTNTGFSFDASVIGDIVSESQISLYSGGFHPTTNRLLANGQTLVASNYSALGIPFSRLSNVYYNTTLNIPIWGTGLAFSTAVYPGSSNVFRIVNNTLGSVTATADGAAATGFTFLTVHTGANTNTQAFLSSTTIPLVYLKNINPGVVADTAAGTSGFTIKILKDVSEIPIVPYSQGVLTTALASIATLAASGLAGLYFTFKAYNSGSVSYYVWFKVNGSGADPAPGGTGIQVNLDTADSATIVAQKVMESLNGFQSSEITTLAASALTAGDYFTFSATGANYYVWYTIDGAGTDPAPVSKTGIKVALLGADTNAQVASKTFVAINKFSFAVPNLQDTFLRGWNATIDNSGDRLSIIPGIWGNLIGTSQQDSIYAHYHTFLLSAGTDGNSNVANANQGNAGFITSTPEVQYTGLLETRPVNTVVNFVIKY